MDDAFADAITEFVVQPEVAVQAGASFRSSLIIVTMPTQSS
jgi:hypothetical protein